MAVKVPSGNGKVQKDPSSDPPASRKEFLAELKEKYNQDISVKNALDSKADKMITLSSAFSTLLIGIGTFLVSRIEPASWLYRVDVVILMIGLLFAASAISLFIIAFRIRDFYFPFGPANTYFPKVVTGEISDKDLSEKNIKTYLAEDIVKKGWVLSKTEFTELAIKRYIQTMKLNSIMLITKAGYLSKGQWLFLGSILSVSLVLLMTLIGIASGVAFNEKNKPIANDLPISNAGSDKEVVENKTVILNGSESMDRDGSIKSYFWNQLSGFQVNIINRSNSVAAFIAPNVKDPMQLEFKLTVTDNKNGTSDDRVNIIVKNDIMQNSSNPIICKGIIPYNTSYLTTSLFHISDNDSEDPFGELCALKTGFQDKQDNRNSYIFLAS